MREGRRGEGPGADSNARGGRGGEVKGGSGESDGSGGSCDELRRYSVVIGFDVTHTRRSVVENRDSDLYELTRSLLGKSKILSFVDPSL